MFYYKKSVKHFKIYIIIWKHRDIRRYLKMQFSRGFYFDVNVMGQIPHPDSYEECLEAVATNSNLLAQVDKRNYTTELFETAIKTSGLALKYIPDEYKTQDLCEKAMRKTHQAFQYIPHKFQSYVMCKGAVQSSSVNLKYVRPDFLKDMYIIAAENICGIAYIPDEEQTPEICLIYVKKNPHKIEFIKPEKQTLEMALIVAEKQPLSIQGISNELRKNYPEINLTAVKKNEIALEFVPFEQQTQEMCKEAIRNSYNNIAYANPPYMLFHIIL